MSSCPASQPAVEHCPCISGKKSALDLKDMVNRHRETRGVDLPDPNADMCGPYTPEQQAVQEQYQSCFNCLDRITGGFDEVANRLKGLKK